MLLKEELLAQAVPALEALFSKNANLQQKQHSSGALPSSQPETALTGGSARLCAKAGATRHSGSLAHAALPCEGVKKALHAATNLVSLRGLG
ncbi:MAG: hypothetical protein KAY08_03060 [Giesbergeria sp.]|nr:hypothetical protein [Giesbergeria sp.]